MAQHDSELKNMSLGIALVFLCHFVFVFMFLPGTRFLITQLLNSEALAQFNLFFLFAILGIGLAQILYVTPLSMYLYRRRQYGLFKGVLIGAILTILLNGSCFLLFASIDFS
jgi:hypothetical protein